MLCIPHSPRIQLNTWRWSCFLKWMDSTTKLTILLCNKFSFTGGRVMWVVTLNKSCIMRKASIYKVLAHLRYLNQSDFSIALGVLLLQPKSSDSKNGRWTHSTWWCAVARVESENKLRLDSESESTRFEVSVLELVEGHELVDLSLSSWST